MRQLHKRISGRVMRDMQDELQALDLSFTQITALHQLRASAPMTVTALADGARLSLPATSHLLERLVRRGLVGRQENPDNRREKLVALTDAGRRVVERMDTAFSGAYADTLTGLDPRLVQETQQNLQALLTALDAATPDASTPDASTPDAATAAAPTEETA